MPIVDENAIVGTAAKHWSGATDWTLVDLRTGEKRARMKSVGEGSAATKTAVVSVQAGDNARPALLHLDTGKIVEAAPTVPEGRVTQVRVSSIASGR